MSTVVLKVNSIPLSMYVRICEISMQLPFRPLPHPDHVKSSKCKWNCDEKKNWQKAEETKNKWSKHQIIVHVLDNTNRFDLNRVLFCWLCQFALTNTIECRKNAIARSLTWMKYPIQRKIFNDYAKNLKYHKHWWKFQSGNGLHIDVSKM